MKLSVSNIVWGNEKFDDFLKLLKQEGCHGIELAPSLIWNEPINSSREERQKLKKQIYNSGLEFVGFHSLLFSRPDLQLFKDDDSRKKTIEYILNLINLCAELGGKQLIFGSPNNRSLHGRDYEQCLKQSHDDFFEIAEQGKKKNVFFCIEPLGKNYTDFIISMEEGGQMVKKINHANFKLHLDTKTIFSNNEDVNKITSEYGDLIQHVHVSDDDLREPGTVNKNHNFIGKSLKKIKYNKFLSIEMKKNTINSIINGINFVKNNYIS